MGKGTLVVLRDDPKTHILKKDGDAKFMEEVSRLYAMKNKGKRPEFKNDFLLQRGPYTIAAVVDEGVSPDPLVLKGKYIDMFDPALPVRDEIVVKPGAQALLLDLGQVEKPKQPQVLAASFRESDEVAGKHDYSFVAKSPIDTDGVARVLLPSAPTSVLVDGVETFSPSAWDAASRTYLLKFENHPDGHRVQFRW